MVGTSNLGSWNGQWKNKTCGPCVKNLLISKGKGCGYFNNTMAPIWVVFIFDASMVFSYLRYLIFLHNQHLIPLSEYEPGLSQWRNETTWTLLRYQTSFSEYVYIYTITPQFQTQGFLHLFQRSSHPFEIPTHLVPTKRSPAKDSEITKPQSPLKLLGFSEMDDQGWP